MEILSVSILISSLSDILSQSAPWYVAILPPIFAIILQLFS